MTKLRTCELCGNSIEYTDSDIIERIYKSVSGNKVIKVKVITCPECGEITEVE